MYNKNSEKQSVLFSGVNKIVGVLVLSDVLITGSFGLIAPILAIFITNNIAGAGLEVVGISTAIYLLTKALFQMITTDLIEKIKGEKDEFYFDFIGALAAAMVYLIFPLINAVGELYIASFILGISAALTYPSWSALFNHHIKDTKTWGVYYTVLDCVLALTAILGALAAASLGFDWLFLIVGVFGTIGAFALLIIKKDIFSQKTSAYPKEAYSYEDRVEDKILSIAKSSSKVATKSTKTTKKVATKKSSVAKKPATKSTKTTKKVATKKK